MVLNYVLLITVAAGFGIAYVFIKLGEQSIAPITEMAGRASIAFIALLIFSLILRKDLLAYIKDLWRFLVFGLLSAVILYLGLSFGEEYTAAGVSSVMVSSVPLITFIILVFILREKKFTFTGLAGLIVGFVGLILVAGIDNVLKGDSRIVGILILLGGFLSFAINGVLVPRIGKGIDAVITTTYLMGLAAIILLVMSFIFESPLKTPITEDNILIELGLGIISTAFAVLGYYFLIKRAGPFFASISLYLVPVFGVVFSFLILGESMDSLQILGIAVVLSGVYLINRVKFKHTASD